MKLNLLLEQFLLEEWTTEINMKKHWLKHCVGISVARVGSNDEYVIDNLIAALDTGQEITWSQLNAEIRKANSIVRRLCKKVKILCFAQVTGTGITPMPYNDFKNDTDKISNAISFNYADRNDPNKLVVFAPWKETYSDDHSSLSNMIDDTGSHVSDADGNCVGYISTDQASSQTNSYLIVMDSATAGTFLSPAYIPPNAYVNAVVSMLNGYKFISIYPSIRPSNTKYKDFGDDIDKSFINPVFVDSHIKNFMKSASNYCRNALVSLLMDTQYRDKYLSGYYDELIATLKSYKHRGDLSKQIFNTQSVEKDVAEIKRLVNEHEEELRVDDVNSPMYNIWHDTHNTFGLSGILNDLADCTGYRNSLQNFTDAMKKHASERLDKGITVAFWKALTAPHMVGGRSKAFWTYFYEYIASEVAEDSTTKDDFFNILDTINALLLFPALKTKFMQEYNKIIDSPYTVIKQSEEDN